MSKNDSVAQSLLILNVQGGYDFELNKFVVKQRLSIGVFAAGSSGVGKINLRN